MTFFGVSCFQRVRGDQGSPFPTPVLAHAGMGTLGSGDPTSSPKLYPWSQMLPLSGECHWFVPLMGDMRGTQTIPLAVVEITEPPDLPLSPLWESSCTCVQWEQFGVNSSANPQCSEWCCLYGAWGEIMLN